MYRAIEKNEESNVPTFLDSKNQGVVRNISKFEPLRNITRAEFVKILIRFLACHYTYMGTETGFSDFNTNEWYAP